RADRSSASCAARVMSSQTSSGMRSGPVMRRRRASARSNTRANSPVGAACPARSGFGTAEKPILCVASMSIYVLSLSVRLVPEPPALISPVIGAPERALRRGLDDRPIVGSSKGCVAGQPIVPRSGGHGGEAVGLGAHQLGVVVEALGVGQVGQAAQR